MPRVHFETSRLQIRDFIPDDWTLIWTLASDPAVTRYQTWLRLPDEAACKQWITEAIRHNELVPRVAYNTAVVLKDNQRPIGWLGWGTGGNQNLIWREGTAADPAYGHGSFGYAVLPQMWNSGYMTEAVRGMVQYAFDVLDLRSIRATCAASNRASARVLQNAGLALVHRWQERDDTTAIEEEHLAFVFQRTDWQR